MYTATLTKPLLELVRIGGTEVITDYHPGFIIHDDTEIKPWPYFACSDIYLIVHFNNLPSMIVCKQLFPTADYITWKSMPAMKKHGR